MSVTRRRAADSDQNRETLLASVRVGVGVVTVDCCRGRDEQSAVREFVKHQTASFVESRASSAIVASRSAAGMHVPASSISCCVLAWVINSVCFLLSSGAIVSVKMRITSAAPLKSFQHEIVSRTNRRRVVGCARTDADRSHDPVTFAHEVADGGDPHPQ